MSLSRSPSMHRIQNNDTLCAKKHEESKPLLLCAFCSPSRPLLHKTNKEEEPRSLNAKRPRIKGCHAKERIRANHLPSLLGHPPGNLSRQDSIQDSVCHLGNQPSHWSLKKLIANMDLRGKRDLEWQLPQRKLWSQTMLFFREKRESYLGNLFFHRQPVSNANNKTRQQELLNVRMLMLMEKLQHNLGCLKFWLNLSIKAFRGIPSSARFFHQPHVPWGKHTSKIRFSVCSFVCVRNICHLYPTLTRPGSLCCHSGFRENWQHVTWFEIVWA